MRPEHGGYGFDPELPSPSLDQEIDQLGRNALTKLALENAVAWIMPTKHQANSLPTQYRDGRLHIIHEGIDTSLASPNPDITFSIRNSVINTNTPTITFVNRNLERLRGFDLFMRSLPYLMENGPLFV